MDIQEISKKWSGYGKNHKDGSIVPYELVLIDNLNGRIELPGYYRIPTKRIPEFLAKWMKSFELGGVNEHVSKRLGYVPYPKRALLKKNNVVIDEWVAPMFYIW